MIDRGSYADWEATGAKTAEQRAASEVQRLPRGETTPLPADTAATLDEIMRREAAAWNASPEALVERSRIQLPAS